MERSTYRYYPIGDVLSRLAHVLSRATLLELLRIQVIERLTLSDAQAVERMSATVVRR